MTIFGEKADDALYFYMRFEEGRILGILPSPKLQNKVANDVDGTRMISPCKDLIVPLNV